MLNIHNKKELNPILLVTPFHTATWFWIDFITKHPNVNGFSTFAHFEKFYNTIKHPIESNNIVTEKIVLDGTHNLFHFHLNIMEDQNTDNKWGCGEHFYFLLNMFPVVVSIVDPMLSMISRVTRHPELSWSNDLVKSYEYLVELDNRYKFLPIVKFDQLVSPEQKLEGLQFVLDQYGLSHNSYMNEIVHKWKAINKSKSEDLKKHYYDRDDVFFKTNHPEMWSHLKNSETILRPFLETHGYTNLLWWD